MELALIGLVALVASGLTLFSGFGLGTILMAVFALFFHLPLAIAATAVVHFADNIFEFGPMAKQANWSVVARSGVPAALTAIAGAGALEVVDRMPVRLRYSVGTTSLEITPTLTIFEPVLQSESVHSRLLSHWRCMSMTGRRFESATFDATCLDPRPGELARLVPIDRSRMTTAHSPQPRRP